MKICPISIADLFERMQGWPHDERGLFMQLILKMYARDGGVPNVNSENAAMFGIKDVRTYTHILGRLLARGSDVLSTDGDLLVNPRALRDISEALARREKARQDGASGGRKSRQEIANDLPAISGRSSVDLPSIFDRSHMQLHEISTSCGNPSPSPSPSPSEVSTPYSPQGGDCDAPGDLDAAKPSRRKVGIADPVVASKFEEFWQAYPRARRTARAKCEQIFSRLVSGKAGRKVDPDAIVAGARRLAAAWDVPGADTTFLKMATTWLNGGCWDDADEAIRPRLQAAGGSTAPDHAVVTKIIFDRAVLSITAGTARGICERTGASKASVLEALLEVGRRLHGRRAVPEVDVLAMVEGMVCASGDGVSLADKARKDRKARDDALEAEFEALRAERRAAHEARQFASRPSEGANA